MNVIYDELKELRQFMVYTGDGGAGSYCSLLYGHKSRLEVNQSVIIIKNINLFKTFPSLLLNKKKINLI